MPRRGVVRLEPLIANVLPRDKLDRVLSMLSAQDERRLKVIPEINKRRAAAAANDLFDCGRKRPENRAGSMRAMLNASCRA